VKEEGSIADSNLSEFSGNSNKEQKIKTKYIFKKNDVNFI
jgi:hypothetical protein